MRMRDCDEKRQCDLDSLFCMKFVGSSSCKKTLFSATYEISFAAVQSETLRSVAMAIFTTSRISLLLGRVQLQTVHGSPCHACILVRAWHQVFVHELSQTINWDCICLCSVVVDVSAWYGFNERLSVPASTLIVEDGVESENIAANTAFVLVPASRNADDTLSHGKTLYIFVGVLMRSKPTFNMCFTSALLDVLSRRPQTKTHASQDEGCVPPAPTCVYFPEEDVNRIRTCVADCVADYNTLSMLRENPGLG